MVKVLIVDDHWLARESVATALRFCKTVEAEIVGEAVNGAEAIEMAHRLRPDVVTMDVGLPDLDGLEATRRLKATMPGLAIVVVTVDGTHRESAKKAGAVAYITKDKLVDELPGCIDSVAGVRPA